MKMKKYGRMRRRFKHLPLPKVSWLSSEEKAFIRANSPNLVIATFASELIAGVPEGERTLAGNDVPF